MTPTADVDTSFDSAFDAFESDGTATPDSPVDDSAAEEVEAPEEETPEAAEVEAATEEVPAKEEAPALAKIEGADMTRDGKAYRVAPERLNNLIAGDKFAAQIREFAPTVEHAKQHYQYASDYRLMHSDFRTGDPQAIDEFLQHWEQESPQAFNTMAERIQERLAPEAAQRIQGRFLTPESLKNAPPELVGKLQEHFVQKFWDDQYLAAGDDPQKLYAVQQKDFAVNGTYKTAEQITRPDPMAERQRQLDARKAELDARDQGFSKQTQAQHDRSWQEITSRVDEDKAAGVRSAIAEAFKPVEGRFSKEQIEAWSDSVERKVEKTLTADFDWGRNQQIDHREIERQVRDALKSGVRNGTPEQQKLNATMGAYVAAHVAKAKSLISSFAAPLVNSATAAVVEANKSKHEKLQSSQKRGASGGGKPTRQSIAAAPGADFDSKFDSFFGS